MKELKPYQLEELAIKGHSEAQYALAKACLTNGKIVQNYRAALYWFEQAATHGHAKALHWLAEAHTHGTYGVLKDPQKAEEYRQRYAKTSLAHIRLSLWSEEEDSQEHDKTLGISTLHPVP